MPSRPPEHDSVSAVEAALGDIRRGRMVILTDDENRENEGDLVMAATKVTPKAINFMATYGRGLICLSLTEDRLRQLALPLMVQDNTSPFQTAFTISIEAAKGVTTGISAADRARTVLAAVAKGAKPSDLVRPGHIFPLRAREGGTLVRTGQTEGSVDLSRLAGLYPAGVICEVMNEDGTMARRSDLLRFSRKHGIKMISVADIIKYRLQRDRLVRRVASARVERAGMGTFDAYSYTSDVDNAVHVALVKGDVSGGDPVLTRVHRGCLAGDTLRVSSCDCGHRLDEALRIIGEAGRGVLLYLQKPVPAVNALTCTHVLNEEAVPGHDDQTRLREFGLGAQILRDLGLRRLRLLTNTPRRIVGLDSYGLKVVEQVSFGRPQKRTARRLRSV